MVLNEKISENIATAKVAEDYSALSVPVVAEQKGK